MTVLPFPFERGSSPPPVCFYGGHSNLLYG
jgi:hypothetical protein